MRRARARAARALVLLAAAVLTPSIGVAAPAPAGTPTSRSSDPGLPAPSLGTWSSLVEGTWEFRSMKSGAVALRPPAASGVIVIDRGVVLAASYVQASAERTVGNLWEGRMVLGLESFEVIPEKGIRYDSTAKDAVVPSLPPRTSGRLERTADGGVRLVKSDGGTITFEPGGRRVQADPDGTTIVHERTSLQPRIPEDLPGRAR